MAVVIKTASAKVLAVAQIQWPLPNHGSSYWHLFKAHDHVVISLTAPNKKCLMNSSARGVTTV